MERPFYGLDDPDGILPGRDAGLICGGALRDCAALVVGDVERPIPAYLKALELEGEKVLRHFKEV